MAGSEFAARCFFPRSFFYFFGRLIFFFGLYFPAWFFLFFLSRVVLLNQKKLVFSPRKPMWKLAILAKIGLSPANFQVVWPIRPANSSSSGFIANFINFTGLNIACAIMFLVRLALSWLWSCFHHTHFMIIFIQCCCSDHILCHDCHPVCHKDQQNMGQN